MLDDMCPECGELIPMQNPPQVLPGDWLLRCPHCGEAVKPVTYSWIKSLGLKTKYAKRQKQDGEK
jgi:rRNA maturation protein Nop10